jgi:hypothetical protein
MNQLIRNIQLHTLIDEKDPHCLYDNNICRKYIHNYSSSYRSHKYFCSKCNESFEIHFNNLNPFIFTFSCKELTVSVYYDTENFSYGRSHNYYTNRLWSNDLDSMYFNFDNKEKLYNKLKTYLVFS